MLNFQILILQQAAPSFIFSLIRDTAEFVIIKHKMHKKFLSPLENFSRCILSLVNSHTASDLETFTLKYQSIKKYCASIDGNKKVKNLKEEYLSILNKVKISQDGSLIYWDDAAINASVAPVATKISGSLYFKINSAKKKLEQVIKRHSATEDTASFERACAFIDRVDRLLLSVRATPAELQEAYNEVKKVLGDLYRITNSVFHEWVQEELKKNPIRFADSADSAPLPFICEFYLLARRYFSDKKDMYADNLSQQIKKEEPIFEEFSKYMNAP